MKRISIMLGMLVIGFSLQGQESLTSENVDSSVQAQDMLDSDGLSSSDNLKFLLTTQDERKARSLVGKKEQKLVFPGSLDSSFGQNGQVNTPIGLPLLDSFKIQVPVKNNKNGKEKIFNLISSHGLICEAGGKFVIAGYAKFVPRQEGEPLTSDFGLVRYNSNGSLDTLFGNKGTVDTYISSGNDQAKVLVQQSDNKLVAAGYANNGDLWALVRYLPDGSLDEAFGTHKNGIVTTDVGGKGVIYGLVQQDDNLLVAAGYSLNSQGNRNFTLIRYNIDGSLSDDFGVHGKVFTDVTEGLDSQANAILLQSDGKLVVAGTVGNDIALARYNKDGILDMMKFGDTKDVGQRGIVITSGGEGKSTVVYAIAQQDEKIVVAGKVDNNFFLARYRGDGVLDTTFGDKGKVVTSFEEGASQANAIIFYKNKLIAAGYSNFNFAFARYNLDGSLDTTFGPYKNGKVVIPVGPEGQSNMATIMAAEEDENGNGKILAAGYSNGGTNFAIVRLID